jgi:8-oxo-dGTP pyrophosphatase MutT (NUDIX family)
LLTDGDRHVSTVRVTVMRQLYRIAYHLLQVLSVFRRGGGRGVKCVLTNSGRVLLVRHTYGPRETWYLPGGGVRRSETPAAAAVREISEELGLRDLPMRELTTVSLRVIRKPVSLTGMHAELQDPVVHPDPVEIGEARWFELDDLPPALGPEVRSLISRLEEQSQT